MGIGNSRAISPIPVLLSLLLFLSLPARHLPGLYQKLLCLLPSRASTGKKGTTCWRRCALRLLSSAPPGAMCCLSLWTHPGAWRVACKRRWQYQQWLPSSALIRVKDGPAVAPLTGDKTWFFPYAPGNGETWASEAIDVARTFAQANSRTLVLAGATPGWPEMDMTLVAVGPENVPEGGSVLWLGDGAAGADFALALWDWLPGTPFGLYGAGTETFRLRVGEGWTAPFFWSGGSTLAMQPGPKTIPPTPWSCLHHLSADFRRSLWSDR